MPRVKKRTAKPTLLPRAMQRALKSAAVRSLGVILLSLAFCTWASLLTWSFADPAVNSSETTSIRNLLGIFGAAWADLAMQLLGLAAIFTVLPLAGWGWRLTLKQTTSVSPARLILWPLAAALIAFALALWPTTTSWPLLNGLGGIAGDALTKQLGIGNWSFLVSASIGITAFILGLALCLIAAAIRITPILSLCASDCWHVTKFLTTIFSAAIGSAGTLLAYVRMTQPKEQLTAWRSILKSAEDSIEDDWPDMTVRPKPAYDAIGDDRIEPFFDDPQTARANRVMPTWAGDESGTLDSLEMSEPDFDLDLSAEVLPTTTLQRNRTADRRARTAEMRLPHLRLLDKPKQHGRKSNYAVERLQENARNLEDTLQDFGVKGEIVRANPGPVVTLYELEPARGVKTSRVIGLADDIARSMSAVSARVAVIPGRNAIGIELPNTQREMVYLRELFETEAFEDTKAKLPLALGKDIGGHPVIADLTRMPHLLIAGTTGSGKSVGINTMIASLLYRLSPDECKLILIDPKMLELSVYDDIPHLLTPVVTDPRKAITALKWTIREMEERYRKMSKLGVRNITGFNDKVNECAATGGSLNRKIQTGFDKQTGRPVFETEEIPVEPMPFIVVVIDEMADLMMVAGKDIEAAVQRLAQMARAAGIHLITATQRPSVDVITGTIKANFPTRVSFRVTTKVDSRTILGEQGAEQLLGDGDMLYMSGGGAITRVHGPFVSDEEIESIVDYLKAQGSPNYLDEVTEERDDPDQPSLGSGRTNTGDELYDRAVELVLRDRKVTISYIQRRLSIGYNKAATLIERMEEAGLISEPNAAGKRQILVDADAA